MAAKFVAPYRMSGKRGKNDAADAAAIAEAVTRPNMRFVPLKSIEQQSRLFVHRARQGYVYAQPTWMQRDGQWFMEQGRWERPRGADRDRGCVRLRA